MKSRARVMVKGHEALATRDRGEPRVYIVLNHSSTFDFLALLHISDSPFTVLMDGAAFTFPIVGRLLRRSGFVPLDKENSAVAIEECVTRVKAGLPLIVSLHDGGSALGERGRPRTGGIRVAHMAKAKLCPVFLKLDRSRVHYRSFKGKDGKVNAYTSFRRTPYFIEFMDPLDISYLPEEPSREQFAEIAQRLDAMLEEASALYDKVIQEGAERFRPDKMRGGAELRVEW